MHRFFLFVFILLNLASVPLLFGQDSDSIPFYEMSIEQLMNVKVSVTSNVPLPSREVPAIITVVTRDQIINSGAHDLMQVLDLIPGLNFGVDVEGVVGLGVRGNWGHEGKVLLLWDGVEMNEELFSTLQFGGHYPVSQIKKIEVSRGPGSAMYGGNAEYCVINIITINNDLDGVFVDGQYSSFSNVVASSGTNVCLGHNFKNGHAGISTYQNLTNRSNRKYIDNYGNAYSLSNLSALNSSQYRLDFALHKFSLIVFSDSYKILQRDGYDQVYSEGYRSKFLNCSINAKYEFSIGKIKFTPGIKIKYEHPWFYSGPISDDGFSPFNVKCQKNLGYLNFGLDVKKHTNVTGGLQYYQLVATNNFDGITFSNNLDVFETYNYSGYIQAIIKTEIGSFIFGSRIVNSKYYGFSFVPRLGYTKTWDNFHFKAIYNRGYRAPSVENVNLNKNIQPEYTTVFELEGGMRIGENSYLTSNIYDITTKDPIVFYYDIINNNDNYQNTTKTGTRGIELEYKLKSKDWLTILNYAFYTTSGHSSVSDYSVPSFPNLNLAFPANKINLLSTWHASNYFTIHCSATYLSERFGKSSIPSIHFIHYPEAVYFNINFSEENVFADGLNIQLGCFNIFNSDINYIQPYSGNHGALPGPSREIQIRLNYRFSKLEKPANGR